MRMRFASRRLGALVLAAALCSGFLSGCTGTEKLGPYPVKSTGLLATTQSHLKPGRSVLVPSERPPGIEKVIPTTRRIDNVEDVTFELKTDRVYVEHYRASSDVAFGCELRPAQSFCFEVDPGVPGWHRTVVMSPTNSHFTASQAAEIKKFFKSTSWVDLREATW